MERPHGVVPILEVDGDYSDDVATFLAAECVKLQAYLRDRRRHRNWAA